MYGRRVVPALLVAVLGVSACSLFAGGLGAPGLPSSSPVRADGMAPADAWLRHHYLTGDPEAALAILQEDSPLRPRDGLLRELHLATALHYAGQFAASDSAFDAAERRIEARTGTSLSATAGALLVSERASEYLPGPTERRMIRYYRILNRLALADESGTLVEARRLGRDLQTIDPQSETACELAVLDHLIGLIFERYGEDNDALVALRRAHRAGERCGGVDVAEDLARVAYATGARDLAPHEPAPVAGTPILLVVERGFVPALRASDLNVPIYAEERSRLAAEGNDVLPEVVAAIADRASGPTLALQGGAPRPRASRPRRGRSSRAAHHVVRFTWTHILPYELARSYPAARIRVGDQDVTMGTGGSPGAAAIRDFTDEQPARLARAVGRGVVRYLAAREVERRVEKRGDESTAAILGGLTNLTLNLLDQPDVRSWSTLPARIEIARVGVPAGEHSFSVEAGGRRDHLAPMVVPDSRGTVIAHRIWSEPQYR